MNDKRSAVAIVLALLAFGYVFTLNPGMVEFQIYPGARVKTSLALVLFLFFLAGFGLALFLSAFREALRSFAFWRHRKAEARQEEARRLLLEGRAHAALGKNRQARRYLQRAYRKGRGETLAALEMARVEIAEGHYDQAERLLKARLSDEPSSAEVLTLLLDLYRRKNDFEGQIAILKRWLEVDPNHVEALTRLRDLYRERGNWAEAVRVEEKLVAQASGRAEREKARRELTELRFRQATSDPARPNRGLLERIIQDDRGFAPAYAALGEALLLAGDRDGAVDTWIRGYNTTGQVGLLLRAEAVREQQGRADEMLKLYRKLGRKREVAPLLQARLLMDLERNQDALEVLEGLPEPVARTRAARSLLGEALYRARSFDQAARAFRTALFGQGPEAPGFTFACTHCGATAAGWRIACPRCGRLDSLDLDLDGAPAPAPA